MQKVISFDKDLEFKTMIGEITSISLDQDLSFVDTSNISGELIVSGKYKLTSASRLEEEFSFHLPVEIALTEKLDLDTSSVTIEDFRYDVDQDSDVLCCHIKLFIEGVEVIDTEEEVEEVAPSERGSVSSEESSVNDDSSKEVARECDSDISMEEKVIPVVSDIPAVEIEEVKEQVTTQTEHSVGSLFSSFKDSDETFATYSVYICRGNDTVDSIMEKYQVTKEELEAYNDLSSLTIGSKVIIPTHFHD